MSRAPELNRRDRILDAAEHAFADFGFEGASMRHIVLDAGVNLATVYYYFESKEALMVAVLTRRFDPLKQRQLAMLEKLASETPDQPPKVERVIELLIAPFLGLAASATGIEQRLIGRVMTEPNPQIQELLCSLHADLRNAFLEQLRRALPGIPTSDLFWRMECTWGALAALLCNPAKIKQRTGGCCDPTDTNLLLAHLVPFFAAGFRAPASPPA
jgi:AcrR family transcriptional regulator